MSNSWYYSLLVPSNLSRNKIVLNIISILDDLGFLVKHPSADKISIVSLDGVNSYEFSDYQEALLYLEDKGGLLTVWKFTNDEDNWEYNVGITIDYLEKNYKSCDDRNIHLGGPNIVDIKISIDGTFYSAREPIDNRVSTAKTLQELFIAFCERLHAIYGFLADENVIEFYLHEVSCISDRVKNLKQPTLLFWLNYFSKEYANLFNWERILVYGVHKIIFQNGIILYSSAYPWEGTLTEIRKINELWQRLE